MFVSDWYNVTIICKFNHLTFLRQRKNRDLLPSCMLFPDVTINSVFNDVNFPNVITNGKHSLFVFYKCKHTTLSR